MKIRFATVDDLPSIIDLGSQLHEESEFSGMDFDGNVIKETLSGLIDRQQFLVVAEDSNGCIAGAMAGSISRSWFGNDMVATDLALIVSKDSRGGLIAYRLVKYFIYWSKLAGVKQIRPGVSTGNKNAETLYERLGFKRCGSNYLMEGV